MFFNSKLVAAILKFINANEQVLFYTFNIINFIKSIISQMHHLELNYLTWERTDANGLFDYQQ
jgi:hypothetical protein